MEEKNNPEEKRTPENTTNGFFIENVFICYQKDLAIFVEKLVKLVNESK